MAYETKTHVWVWENNLCLFSHFYISPAYRICMEAYLSTCKLYVFGCGWFGGVGSLGGVLVESTGTTEDGAEGVSGYNGTWVAGEWSGTGRVNGVSGHSGGVNGEGGARGHME